jgi:putative phosphoesterase
MIPSAEQVSTLLASLYLVGLISDTHGLIRPEALNALRDSRLIIHCGDIGDPTVLEALRAIAPVHAIRGNNDKGDWARNLPEDNIVEVGGRTIYVLHNLSQLDLDPSARGFAAVVSGHSHRPVIRKQGKILFVNPGSAGPQRFKLPVTVATLAIRSDRIEAEIRQLALTQRESGRSF